MAAETPSDDNAEIIRRLYAALDRRDGDAMAALYAPNATFRDPAFGELHGEQIGAMWRTLTASSTDLRASVANIVLTNAGTNGSADWTATYTFTATKRPVTNRIHGEYRFAAGQIVEHVDAFSFWAWSRQALGPAALLLGSNPIGHAIVRRRARGLLGL
jgi:ketosteroid isomerase-like protein